MVVKKSDMQAKDLEQFKSLEVIIDKTLTNGHRAVSIDTIRVAVGHRLVDEAIAWIIRTYSAAGWIVKRDQYADFRDSWDNIIFS